MKQLIILFSILIIFVSCDDYKLQEGEMPLGYNPAEFGTPIYNYETNLLTNEGFELGRALFYDPILSIDSTISCGSCHNQDFAFSDNGFAVSVGVRGQVGVRNSPPLFNLAWYQNFMWDDPGWVVLLNFSGWL